MEHEDKLEAIGELLAECERILAAFEDEEEAEPHEPEDTTHKPEDTTHEKEPMGAAMSNYLFTQNAELRAANRQNRLDSLMFSGQLPGGRPQLEALVKRFCDPATIARQTALALSNKANPDADFNSTVALLDMNPKNAILGERTGVQHPDWIGLTNDLAAEEKRVKQEAADARNFIRPSAQRRAERLAANNGKK
jgi:hypothetical protein